MGLFAGDAGENKTLTRPLSFSLFYPFGHDDARDEPVHASGSFKHNHSTSICLCRFPTMN